MVVIGGLISSTLLTLVIVPVLYRMAEGPGERKRLREEAAEAELREKRAKAEAQKRAQQRAQERTTAAETAQGAAATTTPATDAPRGSLKERGGIVGIVRRRLGRG